MKTSKAQDPQSTDALPATQGSHDSQGEQADAPATEAPVIDSSSATDSSSESKKVSRDDIELVQNLIERCLQLYMNRAEVVKTLLSRAKIEPGFTSLVWQKLEEENSDFFRAYYIRLKLKKQIMVFNHLLEQQYRLMKCPAAPKVPLAPMQNGMHHMTVNNLPMGYPVLQQPPIPAHGQPHMDPMVCGLSNCHIVNGVPAPSNFHPLRINSGNDGSSEVAPINPACSAVSTMSDMAMSPASVASSGHFPFTPTELSGMGVDASVLESAFASDGAANAGSQIGPDGATGSSRDSARSLSQILWNFSFPDLTAELTNLGDLGELENYDGSPFLPSESDILIDSPQHDVEEFFVDSLTGGCSQSDEEKPNGEDKP